MLATPLQMAMVAAAVANSGVVMKPYVVGRITGPDGGVIDPHASAQAQARDAARSTAQRADVDDGGASSQGGTGTAAQIPGIRVAGKTGTAETGVAGTLTRPGSSPSLRRTHPRVAIAVVLENQTGFGGTGRGADREAR